MQTEKVRCSRPDGAFHCATRGRLSAAPCGLLTVSRSAPGLGHGVLRAMVTPTLPRAWASAALTWPWAARWATATQGNFPFRPQECVFLFVGRVCCKCPPTICGRVAPPSWTAQALALLLCLRGKRCSVLCSLGRHRRPFLRPYSGPRSTTIVVGGETL